jgi:Uncharacterised nucleotidyltransferase
VSAGTRADRADSPATGARRASGSDTMARTASLLWESCRYEPSADAIRAMVEGGIDPARVANAALDHGVASLLWRALELSGCTGALDDFGQPVRTEAELLRFQAALFLSRAVAAAIQPLVEAGLEPVVFKGPALSMRYPAPGLRPMGDIDLILPIADHTKALAALRRCGWQVVRASDRLHYDTILAHPDVPGLDLELHHELFSWHDRPNRLRAEDLWKRRVAIDCLGTPAFGLAVEDEVIALAVHAGKPYHCFGRLIWIADLGVVAADAAAHGEIDWELVRHRAARARCETVLAVSLLSADRIGVSSPTNLKEIKGSTTRTAAIEPLLRPEWPLTPLDAGLRHRLRYALADDGRQRALLFAGAPVHEPIGAWPGNYLTAGLRALRRWWGLRRAR